MTKKILYSLFVFFLIFTGCRKDSTITETTIEPTPPIITVETSVLGLVTDLDGNVLEGALLALGNSQTVSDENGYFKLSGLTDSENAIIKVEMAGYFDAWHAFQPFEEDIAQTKIKLTPRNNPLNISANTGGEIQFNNTKINFQAGSFVDETGNAYTGNVSIFTAYLDPTDPELHTFMPGNLTAFDANNRLQLLESFGMINVELEGDGGQTLQITQPATIEMTIPTSIVNKAPATIPLWYFDTEKQRWMEEGSASLQNGKYVGTVNHFTFWNCDVPNDYIQLSGQAFLGESGANLTVCITNLSNDDKRCTETSANDGYFEGAVPSGEELLLEIFSECGDLVYSENIGPFSNDVTVGPYQLNANQTWALVHGNVVDCDGNPVTNGYVLGSWNGNQSGIFNLDDNGSFSKYINTCNASEIILTAIDLDSLKSNDPLQFNLMADTDIGTLEACSNDIVEGIHIEYGNNSYNIPIITTQLIPIGAPANAYEFNAVDDQGNGNKILYKITIVEWTTDLFGLSYEKTIIGSPGIEFDFSNGDISLTQSGVNSGDLVTFEITDVDVDVNGVSHPDGSIQIIGIIQ